MIEPTIDAKYFRSGFKRGHVIGAHVLGRFVSGFGGRVAPPFNRFFMGGENDIRGFDIWGISPMAYVPSEAAINVVNADGTARVQRFIDANGNEVVSPVTMQIPTYQLIFPGGDTQVVTNFEYRIPIFGPVILAGFFDAGLNKISRPGQLRLNESRVNLLNSQFPQAGFNPRARIAPDTQKVRASTGLELQVMMPVVNAPFRLYYAYNPFIAETFLIPPAVADRSLFPNQATFANYALTYARAQPFFEKRTLFRFSIGRTF
jgi:outer membrane protein insertion porin family